MKKFPAYFEDGKEGFERVRYGKDLLLRYFKDRLQILGFDTEQVPKTKSLSNWNVIVEEVPENLKEGFENDIRGRTGYKGPITFLQDDSRVFEELQI
jgi:hypothetical protein